MNSTSTLRERELSRLYNLAIIFLYSTCMSLHILYITLYSMQAQIIFFYSMKNRVWKCDVVTRYVRSRRFRSINIMIMAKESRMCVVEDSEV